jgi:alanine racemase
MTFRLSIDGPAWSRTLREVCDRSPGLVPVIKGNGYGFGAGLLAARCADLGVATVAVGVPSEIVPVRTAFGGEVLVMAPLRLEELTASIAVSPPAADLLRTVAHADVLRAVAELSMPPRVLLELDSPVHRHGISLAELPALAGSLRRVPLAGAAIHLPMGGNRRAVTRSVLDAVSALRATGVHLESLWVSHLSSAEIDWLRLEEPGIAIRPRVGTGLWLADRRTFRVSGTVLDAHPVPAHELIGYRQRRSAAGTLVVVSGGTAHGVGLRAGSAGGRRIDLLRAAMAGAAHGAGFSPSPFHWAGHRLRYADVPHMQVSMLLVPAGTRPPAVGERLTCDVRMTVTTFDEVDISIGGTSALPDQALLSNVGVRSES